MQDASRKLNRIDEFQFPREILKLSVSMYNAKEIDKSELLRGYLNLIDMQTEIGNFKDAKKTLKQLKIFSLNSLNSSDAIKAIENEGYGTYFPLNNLLNTSEVKHKEKLASEFCKRISSDRDGLQHSVNLYWVIGRICWQKQNIVMNLSEIPINFEWGHLALKILHDISLHLELLVKTLEGSSKKVAYAQLNSAVRVDITGITLLLADKDLMNRRKLFSQLEIKTEIYGENWLTTREISYAQRRFSDLDVEKVMPFLEFCHRSLNEGATSHKLNVLKVQLSTFKNSLKIMKQFGDSKKTMTFQPVETELKFELVRGQEL